MIELALGISMHLALEQDYNALHPHIRYIDNGIMTGAYYNSVEKVSTYVGYRWEISDFGFEAAAVTGYPEADFVPFVRGTYKDFFIAPAMEEGKVGAVIGYEIKF